MQPAEKLPRSQRPEGKGLVSKPKILKATEFGLSMTIQAPKAIKVKLISSHKIFFSTDTESPKKNGKHNVRPFIITKIP